MSRLSRISILLSTLLLLISTAAFAQDPAGQPQVDPAAQAQPQPTVDTAPQPDTRPIGVQLAAAVTEFTKAVQAAERGAGDVSDAQAEEDRLEAELQAARQATQTASGDLGDLQGATRTAGEAVIGLMTEYLKTLPE